MLMATSLFTVSCEYDDKEKAEEAAPLIERPQVDARDGRMTPEILNSLARIGNATLSPDGTSALYGVSFVSIEQDRSNRELFTVNIDGSNKKQVTKSRGSESNEVWIEGGKRIAFLSGESGSSQIWVMNADGTERKQVTNHDKSIDGFLLSPDEAKVAFICQIPFGKATAERYPDLPKAKGRVIEDMMYKHWDEWVETIPHTFWSVLDWNNGLGAVADITEGEPFEVPMKPFGGIEDLAWSSDGNTIAYASRKKTGLEQAVSTNTDIYLYDINTKATRNITEGMMGYDTHPVFSPDGAKIAWLSMERDGYESDKSRLFIMDLKSGDKTDLTSGFDYSVESPVWYPNSQAIGFLCGKEGTVHLWEVNLNKQFRQITNGEYDYTGFSHGGNNLIAMRHSMKMPAEVYRIDPATGEAAEISFENEPILSQLTMGNTEARWIETTDGKKMLTWVIYPPDFDPAKKYPALLYCVGGPQSMIGQGWSYRWNYQLMAANGYIVVAPNRRGVPGFGSEWVEQISGDYGGQNMKDYFSAIDALAKEPYVDEDHLGAVGASYGGFSVYWLAGNHNKRFKAFAAHAGIFNLEMQYVETEELWFANWDMGGAYWDKDNKVARNTYENVSPHLFVDKWDTPILITHGEYDFRILASQGMAAFNAAKMRGIPAEMVIFPDESHWILKPQNSILFHRRFFNWLDRWLK